MPCFIYRIHRWPTKRAAKRRQRATPRHVTTKTEKGRYVRGVIYGCNTWRHFVRFCISVVTLPASSALFCPPRAPLVMPRSLRAPVDFPWLINPDEISIQGPFFLFPPFCRDGSHFREEKKQPPDEQPFHQSTQCRDRQRFDTRNCGCFIANIYHIRKWFYTPFVF